MIERIDFICDMAFSNDEISQYYSNTQVHYEKFWNLSNNLAIHYGLWFEGTRDFGTALQNTNREMAKLAQITGGEYVLDAGCGVGGAALFLNTTFNCKVHGVTLSEKQLQTAEKLNIPRPGIDLSLQDFSKTNFKDESFDVVWACESSLYANPKSAFIDEALRLLKPGGRIVIADYFKTTQGFQDKKGYIKKWIDLWAIDDIWDWPSLSHALVDKSLTLTSRTNYTEEVTPSSKRMMVKGRLGSLASILYNLTHKTSRFAKHHYKSGIYQYKALMRGDWEYYVVVLKKTA